MDLFGIGAATLFFIAVFLGIEGLYLWWRASHGAGARRLARRLASAHGEGEVVRSSVLRAGRLGANATLERVFSGVPGFAATAGLLAQSNVNWSPIVPIFGSAVIALAGVTLLSTAVQPRVLGLALGLLPAALPWLYLMRKRSTRLARIEELLPDALDMLSRSLRAGHSLNGALKIVGDEMPDIIAEEFQRTVDEINFGVAMPEALQALAARTPSDDMRYFVIALMIQRETGGNLAEVLGKIATLIRDRIKLRGRIRTLSADGRTSAMILGVLPFATAAVMYLIDSKFISMLWTEPFGLKMLTGTALLMILGVVWMSHTIRIRI